MVPLAVEVLVGVKLLRQRHANGARTPNAGRDCGVLVSMASAVLGMWLWGAQVLLEGSNNHAALGNGRPAGRVQFVR